MGLNKCAANKQGKTLILKNKADWTPDGANIPDWLETVLNTTQERRENVSVIRLGKSPKIITAHKRIYSKLVIMPNKLVILNFH